MFGIILLYFILFLFGLCIGSFLNVALYRLRPGSKKRSLKGHSVCPQCGHRLKWYELIPLLSFVFLRAKCLQCKQPISRQYPLVEFFTGVVFVLSAEYLRGALGTLSLKILIPQLLLLIVVSFFVLLFVYDLKYLVLPNNFLYPALFFVFLLISYWSFMQGDIKFFLNGLEGALTAGGFFALLVFISKERWMGQGDIFLGILIGLLLGWPKVLVGLFFAFVSGGLIGVVLVLLRKKQMKSQVPFGPFLLGGSLAALFWGAEIIKWYFH